ncbi:hypothetical protein TNCV_1209751 [Trichonephila clavipes]|nr:hypothetical protein TNCV_1209751 [Trichonephila clavipes]
MLADKSMLRIRPQECMYAMEDDPPNMETDPPDKTTDFSFLPPMDNETKEVYKKIRNGLSYNDLTKPELGLLLKREKHPVLQRSETSSPPDLPRTATDSGKCHALSDTKKKATNPSDTQRAAPDNEKRRKQKDSRKKATGPLYPPPTIPDLDRCRQHKELKKDISMMNGRLAFLEHCIRSEKEFSDLTDDATLAAYQKDYDDLASLKERKTGELALFLPCPVLDFSENLMISNNVNDPPKSNVKKHAKKESQKNRKVNNATSKSNDGFASPKNCQENEINRFYRWA